MSPASLSTLGVAYNGTFTLILTYMIGRLLTYQPTTHAKAHIYEFITRYSAMDP